MFRWFSYRRSRIPPSATCRCLCDTKEYLPSSVDWFFSNDALLYKKGEESRSVRIEPGGANLPNGGDPAGLYWLDLPVDKGGRDRVSHDDIASAEAYVHFKTGVENGMFTDIQIGGEGAAELGGGAAVAVVGDDAAFPTPEVEIGAIGDDEVWMFYPFNGHATAKIGLSLGRIGEHFAWYSSRNGHAGNNEPGLYLQGPGNGFGIRNDWARSNKVVDTGARFVVVASEGEAEAVVEL
ncbi:hypothetical protein SASPL_143618 [Salvia splendens]|uniref:Uncharacterized protein n=1 Tax=Salvia splendens TaxID=180675 RepID=A0A8X8ZA68_SALSN|nr:hypothetical protein SASPL_143618 [Salvia splendens]